MPIYLTEDPTLVVGYGYGDILSVPRLFKIGKKIFGVLELHDIEPGKIGRPIENNKYLENVPPVTLTFECVESLDIVIDALNSLKNGISGDPNNEFIPSPENIDL